MSFEIQYEQLVEGFEPIRREILQTMSSVIPNQAEMHKREWRFQQLVNTSYDIKETIVACNEQLKEENAILEEATNEYHTLNAQKKKLIDDLKLLECMTGITAVYPTDTETLMASQIAEISSLFRQSFETYYSSQPTYQQKLKYDDDIERDAEILVASFQDYVTLEFDSRSDNATLSKDEDDGKTEIKRIRQAINDKQSEFEKELSLQKARIEGNIIRMRDSIFEQGKQLKVDGNATERNLQELQSALESKIGKLTRTKKGLAVRKTGLQSQSNAIKESLERRVIEIEEEIDGLLRRIKAIRKDPSHVDQRLLNMTYLLSSKSKALDEAIARMKHDIYEFKAWLN